MQTFNSQTGLIESQAQLDELCAALAGKTIIALDTEFVRTDTYFPKLCLFQLATDAHIAGIDVLADLDTGPLREILIDGRSLKLIHAAKQDLEAFHSTYGQLPEPIFDTQIAAGLLGYQTQIGYANLVRELTGIELDKGQTRTDWSRRPLTEAQIRYARDDVRHLAELHAKLKTALESSGRYEWALEDSADLVDPGLYVSPPSEAWRRLSKIPFLPPPVQARARRLAVWRERRAQRINRPRLWILSDKALLAIADTDPGDEAGLNGLPDLAPGVIRSQGPALIGELRQANRDFESGNVQLHQASKPAPPSPQALRNLSGIVGDKADELGIAPELLTTRRDLAALLRGQQDIKALAGWRLGVIGEALLQAL